MLSTYWKTLSKLLARISARLRHRPAQPEQSSHNMWGQVI
jgi:hypothetical protein